VGIPVWNTWWLIASLALCIGIGTPSQCAGHSTSAANPYRHQKGRTRWDALESTMGPDHRERAATRNAFFPGPPGRRFCPRFYEMGTTDKRTFWAYFFQALAGAEAGLNPNTSVRHSEPEGALAMRSEGLLQLAYADHKRYGCKFNWQVDRALKLHDPAKTILQPKNNLECGVKILFNQTIVQHKPLLSRSGYWSTLRPGGPSYLLFAKQMTNPPAACGSSTKSVIAKSATTKSVRDDANRGETPK
jgi:hypothetical protein